MASTDGEEEDADKWYVPRRPYVQALVGAGLMGLAGCGGGGGGGDTTTQTTTTTTATTTTEDDSSSEGGGDTTEDTTEETTKKGEPVATMFTSTALDPPEQTNVNPWAATVKNSGINWYRELVDPQLVPAGNKVLWNGHEWKTPHFERDSIQLITWQEGIELEPPFDYYRNYNSDIKYWDGTPMNARSRVLHDKTWYYFNGNKFDPAATFNTEADGEWRVHGWRNKGKAPKQQPDPTNEFILRGDAIEGQVPFHPNFTEPFVTRFEEATTKKQVNKTVDDLKSQKITFNTYAEKGYGSSLYKLNPDRITAEHMVAELWDDHPNDWATVPELELKIATSDRREVLVNRGEIDTGGGIVQDKGGRQNRQQLPDYIQEIDRFLDNGSDQMLFNWNNPHVANLWVRRAIVARVDWINGAINGWGEERTIPLEYDVGLTNTSATSNFSKEFLESLHKWPQEPKPDLAAEYMRKGGYSKSGGTWSHPEHGEVTFTYVNNSQINDWTGLVQTVKSNLQDFGFGINLKNLDWPAYTSALEPKNLNYDIGQQWAPGSTDVWKAYNSRGAWWTDNLIGGDSNDGSDYWEVDAKTASGQHEDKVDNQGKPLEGVQLPKDPKNISAPNDPAKAPELSQDSITVDMADVVTKWQDPELTQKEFDRTKRICARYYNFYLPDFMYHQYTWGVYGNVRDWRWPPRGHPANRTYKGFSSDDTLLLSGMNQTKFDKKYEKP